MGQVKIIEIHESIFAENDRIAEQIRNKCKENHILFLNVMSSPGSGKTTMLIELINQLKEEFRIFEMDVDITSTLDSQRVADQTGIPSVQIHNGGLCHIDADMVSHALEQIDLTGVDLLILENIGNLVCPAEFDTGASRNIMILSVPEGDDKPLKYPLMFQVCDLVVISKIDTLEYCDFNIEEAEKRIHNLNPLSRVIPISARTGEGMDELKDWIREAIREQV